MRYSKIVTWLNSPIISDNDLLLSNFTKNELEFIASFDNRNTQPDQYLIAQKDFFYELSD